MTTASLDCSSGRGRRAPLLLSGLVASCPVRSGSALPSPFPPCLRVFPACARNNRYERRRLTRGARAPVLRPLETTPGMRNFLIPAGLRDTPSLRHYISTEPYSRQPPSAAGHDFISVTPTRETPIRENPTRANRPQHVCVCVCVCVCCVVCVQAQRGPSEINTHHPSHSDKGKGYG